MRVLNEELCEDYQQEEINPKTREDLAKGLLAGQQSTHSTDDEREPDPMNKELSSHELFAL